MRIILNSIGKRFDTEWVFRDVNYIFDADSYVLLGANGSGKSTMLQLLAGYILPTEGEIIYSLNDKKIPAEKMFRYVSVGASYLELYENCTLDEAIQFHFSMKPVMKGLDLKQIKSSMDLPESRNKRIIDFSSGMKQRLKLGMAILADTPLLLLDEPLSHLDFDGMQWYHDMIKHFGNNRLIIVCSNMQQNEYDFCRYKIQMENYR